MAESALMREIMLAASKTGARVFRNNTGQGWVGHMLATLRTSAGIEITLGNARPFHAGLCLGSSDLIGWTADGRFLAIEVKSKRGVTTEAQRNFIAAVRSAGGVAFAARSVEEAMAELGAQCRNSSV